MKALLILLVVAVLLATGCGHSVTAPACEPDSTSNPRGKIDPEGMALDDVPQNLFVPEAVRVGIWVYEHMKDD
jgi:hypothetical protein